MRNKIHILSSLYCNNNTFHIPNVQADYLVLGGNCGDNLRFINPLINAAARYKEVFVVLGNNDYTDKDIVYIRRQISETFKKHNIDNVSILSNNFRSIQPTDLIRAGSFCEKGIILAGSTLWTDFSNDKELISNSKLFLSEFSGGITVEGKPFTTDEVIEANNKSKEFLNWFSTRFKKSEYKKIVVTNNIPSIKLLREDIKNNPLAGAFVSDCEHILENIDIWICGHEYCKPDTMINGCRVLSNTRGRTTGSKNFNPELVIEI